MPINGIKKILREEKVYDFGCLLYVYRAILDTPDQLAVMDNLEESVYRVLLAPLVSLDKMEQKEILDLLVKKASRGLKDL